MSYTYAFILGHEWRLSLAELGTLFGFENLTTHNENIAIFELKTELQSHDIFTIGGSTRIIRILEEIERANFWEKSEKWLTKNIINNKISFALASFGGANLPLAEIWMRLKKNCQKKYSVRLLNTKNENIHSAVFKREKLAKTKQECCFVTIDDKNFFGYTIACQDIDAYSRRDTTKCRDMQVGMMPPKLVQIMLNFLPKNIQKNGVYDPFCGLGTTLIESANHGIYTLVASDISEKMVENTKESVEQFIAEEKEWQAKILKLGGTPNKDFSNIQTTFFTLDATTISKAFLEKNISREINIVSEWYLGKMITKEKISQDVVFSERRSISRMYEQFFASLKEAKFSGNLVMSFPFWEVNGVHIFLDNITEIITKNGFQIQNLIPREYNLNTKNGSLLYRRKTQNVGREIIHITAKNGTH